MFIIEWAWFHKVIILFIYSNINVSNNKLQKKGKNKKTKENHNVYNERNKQYLLLIAK